MVPLPVALAESISARIARPDLEIACRRELNEPNRERTATAAAAARPASAEGSGV